MSAMQAGSDGLGADRRLTVQDLESLPEDGRRYELLDEFLLVSPASGFRHQKMTYRLHRFLEDACPDKFEVIGAPFAVRPSDRTELQPDVLVARAEDVTEGHLPVAPVLVVEVLSPSSAVNDLNAKKAAYEHLGVSVYWVLDPVTVRLIVFELDADGTYQQVVDVQGDGVFPAVQPFPVEITPATLLARRVGEPEPLTGAGQTWFR